MTEMKKGLFTILNEDTKGHDTGMPISREGFLMRVVQLLGAFSFIDHANPVHLPCCSISIWSFSQ